MKLTNKFKIPYDEILYQVLKTKQLEAGKVWTDIIRYANQHYSHFHKWITKGELETYTKNTYDLAAQTVQGIVAKYEVNRQATKELRKTNKKFKYPWKYKTFFMIPYKKASIDIHENRIILKNSNYSSSLGLTELLKRVHKKKRNKKDKAFYSFVPKQKDDISIPNLLPVGVDFISYAEIIWKKGSYWFHYTVEKQEQENQNPFKPAGGDLGEIHSIAVSTEDEALIISGRAIRSIKQWRSKTLSHLNKLMSRCKNGSRQWKKYRQAKFKIRQKSEQQLYYLYHKTTKEVMNFLEQEQVTHFVVGNPEGIEKNTKQNEKKKKKNNKTRRQHLSQWSYGDMKEKLNYKAKMRGIEIEFVNESYTSQDCPFCNGRHKASGRNFICSVTKQRIHRDVNGAQNIARKKYKMDVHSVEVNHRQPVWFKQFLSDEQRQKRKQPTDKLKKSKVSPSFDGVVGTELALV